MQIKRIPVSLTKHAISKRPGGLRSKLRAIAWASSLCALLFVPAKADYTNWEYDVASLSSGYYGNIVDFPGAGQSLDITLNPGARVGFGNPGNTFTIYSPLVDKSRTRIDKASLSSINLSNYATETSFVQFGGDGIEYQTENFGYNGGAGAEDSWALTGGQSINSTANMTFQSGGNGTDAIDGHDALNGGDGGTGGNSVFSLNDSSAILGGQTIFGGDGGNGGRGSNYSSTFNPTKGGKGGMGGNASWTVTNSTVEFKDSARFGGTGGDGGIGGQGSAENSWASHGTGGAGGDAILTLNSGGKVRFFDDAFIGGNGGDSVRGTAGAGGAGSITLAGGGLQFDRVSQLGGKGGQTSLGTAGAGGEASVLLSGGNFIANQSVQWGGQGGAVTVVGGVAGNGGKATVSFNGASVSFVNAAGLRHQFGGDGGDSLYKSGSGGAANLYFQGGSAALESADMGGTGGQTSSGQAGAGGAANLYFGNATTNLSDIQIGGIGGQASCANATAGEGGKATIYYDNGTHTITDSTFGGTGGAAFNDGNNTYLGAHGGAAEIHINGGALTFDRVTFGGLGSTVSMSDSTSGSGTGGVGGDVSLSVNGGNTSFGRVVFGGTGGLALNQTGDQYSGSAGAGGNVTATFSKGGVNFNDIVIFGGQGGLSETNGAGGNASVSFSGATVRFSNLTIFGGLNGGTQVSGLPSGYIDQAGKGTVYLTGGTVIVENGARLTSYNSNSSFQATGGLLLFNVQPTRVGANNQVEMGSVEFPRVSIKGSAQLGITMSDWQSGTYELDKSSAALVADDANSLDINSTTYDRLFYSLDVFRGEGNSSNSLFLDKVTVRDPEAIWSQAGGNVGGFRTLALPEDADDTLNNMLMQSQSYEELETAVDHFGGTMIANANVLQLSRISSINQTVLTQIVQANGVFRKGYVYDDSPSRVRYLGSDQGILSNNKVAPWAGYYGGTGDMGFNRSKAGYDLDSDGWIVGVDLPLCGFRLGGYYAFGESKLQTQSLLGAGRVDADDHLIGLYGKWNAFLLSGYSYVSGNYSYSSYDSQRILTDGSAFGSYKNKEWGVYYERGWQIPFMFLIFNPHFALQYEDLHTNAFTESGASDLRMSFDRSDLESFRGVIGVRSIVTMGFFELSGSASYMREMGDLDPGMTATLVSTADSMQIWGNGGSRDMLNAGVGVNLSFGSLSLMANYNLIMSSEITFHAGIATVRYKF